MLAEYSQKERVRSTDVELPPLDVLARVLVGNDDDQLGDLAAHHPLVQLGHDLLDVCADLVIGGDEHVQAIFLDGGEVFGRVDASLETGCDGLVDSAWRSIGNGMIGIQNGMDGVLKLSMLGYC